jgi:hypothetical protein
VFNPNRLIWRVRIIDLWLIDLRSFAWIAGLLKEAERDELISAYQLERKQFAPGGCC